MRIYNINTVPRQHIDDPDFTEELQTIRLGEAAGSEKLYVNIDFVKPGSQSAKYHSHDQQEEFFLIMAGTGVLRMNDVERRVNAGDFVAKPAGKGIAHQFINDGKEILQILDCGTKNPDDVITYPDEDIVYLRRQRLVFKRSSSLDNWSS